MSSVAVLDLLGLTEGALVGFAPITPVAAIAAALCVHDYATGLDDQKKLTLMLGLDASPVPPPPDPEPRPQVQPDVFRRTKNRRH